MIRIGLVEEAHAAVNLWNGSTIAWWKKSPWTAFWLFLVLFLVIGVGGAIADALVGRWALRPFQFLAAVALLAIYASYVQGIRISWRRSSVTALTIAIVGALGLWLLLGNLSIDLSADRRAGSRQLLVLGVLVIAVVILVPFAVDWTIRHFVNPRGR